MALAAALDRAPVAKAPCLPTFVERWCHLGLIQREPRPRRIPRGARPNGGDQTPRMHAASSGRDIAAAIRGNGAAT